MNALENVGNLVERLADKIEAVIDDRDDMFSEISDLRKRLIERDKEAVKAAQDMRAELEVTRMAALRFEQELARMEARLQTLNGRLAALAGSENQYGD